MKRADEATRAVRGVKYQAQFAGRGSIAKKIPAIEGKAQIAKFGQSGKSLIAFRGVARLSSKNREIAFDCGSDREMSFAIDHDACRMRVTREPFSRELLGVGLYLWMREFGLLEPFADELRALEMEVVGREEIAGEPCTIVHVVYQDHAGIARWAFSDRDALPRRVERILPGGEPEASTVLTLTQLEILDQVDPAEFRPKRPNGYELEEILVETPRLLTVGETAPDFRLRSPAGEKLALSDRRGQVTLLFFWATWCVSCKDALPRIQKLNDRFEDEKYSTWAISTWDFGDPISFFEERGYGFELLLSGDDIASRYGLSVVPTAVLVDGEGRIANVEVGFDAKTEARLAKSIRHLVDR